VVRSPRAVAEDPFANVTPFDKLLKG